MRQLNSQTAKNRSFSAPHGSRRTNDSDHPAVTYFVLSPRSSADELAAKGVKVCAGMAEVY